MKDTGREREDASAAAKTICTYIYLSHSISSISLSHTLNCLFSLSRTHSHSIVFSFSLSLEHTHTQSSSLSLSLTHTQSSSLSYTHQRTLSRFLLFVLILKISFPNFVCFVLVKTELIMS